MISGVLLLETALVFIRFTVPVIMVLSLILFIQPKVFTSLEKKLSEELGSKKISRKTVEILEKENYVLQQALLRNNRIVGLSCFVLAIIIIAKLY